MGRKYVNNSKELRAFARIYPSLSLTAVNRAHVRRFLNRRPVGRHTWGGKYARLKAFFAYWLARQEIQRLPMPRPRRQGRKTFSAYIFTQSQIRAILKNSDIHDRQFVEIRPRTFRMLIVLLYATGIWVSEALSLQLRDLDLRDSVITLSARMGPPRQIPIGPELTESLSKYIGTSSGPQHYLFVKKNGFPILTHRAAISFRRVRQHVGIQRNDGAARQPGLRDLRHTFAVNRIAEWLKNDVDLDLMLPRLAAYMGLSTLGLVNRYLPLTPMHFRQQLDDLSRGI
jgi:integrase/recombinase XerD